MVRSSYGIGDMSSCTEDLLLSWFCPCCVTNQLYQTTKQKGNPTVDGGRHFNVHPMLPAQCHCGSCMYASVCMPCSIGTILSDSVGMPFLLGCCCFNLFNARNIVRYQYRLRGSSGSDCVEECLTPFCIYCVANIIANIVALAFPILYVCLCPALCGVVVGIDVVLQQEAATKKGGERHAYLRGYSPPNGMARPIADLYPIRSANISPVRAGYSQTNNATPVYAFPQHFQPATSSYDEEYNYPMGPYFATAVKVQPENDSTAPLPVAEAVSQRFSP